MIETQNTADVQNLISVYMSYELSVFQITYPQL
jgi:hypothetical protein